MSPDGSSLGTTESVEGDGVESSDGEDFSSDDEGRRGSSATSNSKGSISRTNSEYFDYIDTDSDEASTMWLGTQDGQ